MSQLKVAQQKFADSKENVKKLMNKESGKTNVYLGNTYTVVYLLQALKMSSDVFYRKAHPSSTYKLCILLKLINFCTFHRGMDNCNTR